MNTNVRQMNIRCPDSVRLGKATLFNHKLVFKYHADVEYSKNSVVEGVLWRVTDKCLKSLDRLEGYPHYYDRIIVPVLFEGEVVKTSMYVMNGYNEYMMPSNYYLNMLKEGYHQNRVNHKQIDNALDMVYDHFY